jgi:hypothetical protein
MKIEQTECFKTSAYKIQTLGNCPEESVKQSEHGECLKSRLPAESIIMNTPLPPTLFGTLHQKSGQSLS